LPKICSVLLAISFRLPLTGQSTPIRAATATVPQTPNRALDRVRNSPLELRAFLERMPKGADLHTHLGGAVYAETLIHDAVEDQLCVETATATLVPSIGTTHSTPPQPVCGANSEPVIDALGNPDLYTSLIDGFSMRSFVPSAGISGHDHFFATFTRFGEIDGKTHVGEWLDELAKRAASQNEQYLEIMQTPDSKEAIRIGREVGWSGNLPATRDALLAKGLRQNIETARKQLDEAEKDRLQRERCSGNDREPACAVRIRFLFQVPRAYPPERVFAQTLLGFELASADPDVVGINLVMPEDSYLSMTEYHRQMEMLDYLHSVYPAVHITLHAGELAPGLVPPDGLKFHIREAVQLAHAERIGHGVDLMYEREPQQLLKEMATRHVMVEINLSSNDLILGITGKSHPLPIYRAAHVPVGLSTDDEGVSRIDLTHEYERAVEEFGLSYEDLKNMARTSIEHSFLPGTDLWLQADLFNRTAAACSGTPSGSDNPPESCAKFVRVSEKAQQEWELEKRFRKFEANIR
jgi:adenosine deaminase